MSEITYFPIIKGKFFEPSPVARFGTPSFADSASYPSVEGSVAHEEWWNEQIDRCINGYTTSGVFIPGRYYYYLNFCLISTVKRGNHYPEYVDIDLEFFRLIEQAKKEYKGIICIKARRRGLSFKVLNGLIDHGFRFRPNGYSAGVCAGLDTYSVGFFKKLKESSSLKPRELQLHYLKDDESEILAGWKEQSDTGMIAKGSRNRFISKTMNKDPNVFKGERFDDVVFEEAGENLNLIKGYGATKDCFAVGAKMVGFPVVFGTGGKMDSSSKGFSEMWHESDSYDLIKFEVMAPRLFIGCFGGSRNENGDLEEDIPNLMHLTPEERIGVEDVKRAEEKILEERKRLLKAKNKDKYYDYLQNNPLNAKEAFLKFSGNNFDAELLSNQRFAIQSIAHPMYSKYSLEWVKKDDGSIKYPLEVIAIPATELTPEEDCILIRYHPIPTYKNLDIAGGDSYDVDEARSSYSLGAMTVLRRKGHAHRDLEGNTISHKRIPVCVYRRRPRRKELFYENCLKISVYYNLIGNTLIDIGKPMIIEYYKRFGGQKYLSLRPKSFESENSEQSHEYGVALTMRSKPQMIGLLQTWIVDEVDECWFPLLVQELIDYDVQQKTSDWDLADSLGIALMKDADMKRAPVDSLKVQDKDPYQLPQWKTLSDGRMVDIGSKKSTEDIKDPFLRGIYEGKFGI